MHLFIRLTKDGYNRSKNVNSLDVNKWRFTCYKHFQHFCPLLIAPVRQKKKTKWQLSCKKRVSRRLQVSCKNCMSLKQTSSDIINFSTKSRVCFSIIQNSSERSHVSYNKRKLFLINTKQMWSFVFESWTQSCSDTDDVTCSFEDS